MTKWALATVLLLGLKAVHAAPKTYDTESDVVLGDTKFTVSAGWSFDDIQSKLVSPEGDVIVYLREQPFKENIEALSLDVWKTIDPHFSFKVLLKSSPPPKDGWEQAHQIVYEVPARENRTVLTLIRVSKGTAYMLLLDASNAGLSKRAAQLQVVVDTWRPTELKRVDLSHNKAKVFTDADAAEFDAFISKAMQELSLPGVSIAILQNGQFVYRKAFGVKQLGMPDKVTPQTLFMIGSTTKPLTTLMLAKLVEEGKLTWDTPIEKALPSFALADKDVSAKFLVKHTACACTGMPRRDMDFVFGSLSNSVEDTLRQLRSMNPTTGFGETFQYSNQLVAVGGLLGGNVYGKGTDLFSKYENAMNDLVFAPLGMTSTRVRPTALDQSKLARPHARDFDGKTVRIDQKLDDMVYALAPAGSVWSSVDDLAKYVLMELRNGKGPDGTTLFSQEQLLKRRTPGVKISETTTYGLGLVIENNNGLKIVGHNGGTLGFSHDMFFMPDHGLGLIVQTNAGEMQGFSDTLKQKLLEVLLGIPPRSEAILKFYKDSYKQMEHKIRERVSLTDTQWIENYVGEYGNKDLGRVAIVKDHGSYVFKTPRWQSRIGTAKEQTGEKLLALVSAPWSGGIELRAQKEPSRKLILDNTQSKYEFAEIAK